MRIAIGSDHAGFPLKQELAASLVDAGHQVDDLGTTSDERVDYPDFGAAVGRSVASGASELGVCVCGTGIGISIAANKVDGVRAAVIHDVTSARLAKEHNDANVVCLGARLVGPEVAQESLHAFLATTWQAGRHAERVDKITALEHDRSAP
ncbi:ribose 5-phosphate isomerase B [soil metagenome]|jgi:ribose 5-phosphate isomerase B|nr:ribose 5-phosphate isomerase B [Acidimicrobiia bacterium]MBA3955051.1 ribose 5-phosphate isomerase B [Acidimicrobiia bacterium]